MVVLSPSVPYPEAYTALLACIRSHAPLAIAFSGGLDSRFLAFAAAQARTSPVLVHATGPHVMEEESLAAQAWAHEHKLLLILVPVNPLDSHDVVQSGAKRCYHCKKLLFSAMLDAVRTSKGTGYTLCDGTNADDLLAFRPGLVALQELGIISPLALSGFGKRHISETGEALGFDNPRQAARPCLLTRFPYNAKPLPAQLRALGKAEALVEHLLVAHASAAGRTAPVNFRLRCEADYNPGLFTDEASATTPLAASLLTVHLHADMEVPEPLASKATAMLAEEGVTLAGVCCTQHVSGYFDTPAIIAENS